MVFVSALEMFINGHGMMPEYENKDVLKDHQRISEFKKQIENLPKVANHLPLIYAKVLPKTGHWLVVMKGNPLLK